MSSKLSVLRGPKAPVSKTRIVTIADITTARQIMTLPKGSRLLYFIVGGVASDAATTATLSFGNTTTSTEWVTGFDVKTAATGTGPSLPKMVSGKAGLVLTVDTPVYALYAETGTGATVGSWFVTLVYTTGNITNDTTV